MVQIREYGHRLKVDVKEEFISSFTQRCFPDLHVGDTRLVVQAFNAGGWDSTSVDLLDVLAWVKENRPDLLNEIRDAKETACHESLS